MLLLCSLAPLSGQDEQLHFEHITVDDGLSGKYAVVNVQDDQGFLWISSNGLLRYDGYTFKSFQHEPDDPNSISSSDITNTSEAILYSNFQGNHELWICTGKGLSCLDLETEKFTNYYYDIGDTTHWMARIYEDKLGELWVNITFGGFFHFNRATGEFTQYLDNWIGRRWLYENEDDTLWMCASGGKFSYFDRDLKEFIPSEDHTDPLCQLCEGGASKILVDNYKQIWGYGRGLGRYNTASNDLFIFPDDTVDSFSFAQTPITYIYEANSGNIWGNIKNFGLIVYDRQIDKIIRYPYDPTNGTGINTNFLYGGLIDNSDVIWVGGAKGLNKWTYQKEQFHLLRGLPEQSFATADDNRFALLVSSDDDIWYAVSNGLIRLDAESTQKSEYNQVINFSKSSKINLIQDLAEDTFGYIWAVTTRDIFKIDTGSGKILLDTKYPFPQSQVGDATIQCVLADREGRVWIGARWQMHEINPLDGTPLGQYLPEGTAVRTLYQDVEGLIWVGSWRNGLYIFDPFLGTWKKPQFSSEGDVGLRGVCVSAITESVLGNYWIGTESGLTRLVKNQALPGLYDCTNFTMAKGLASDVINSVVQDKQGDLWMGTDKGLVRFDLDAESFRNYDKSDGLAANSFARNSAAITKRGELFFGSDNGITWFHPDSIKNNPNIPPIVLTDFQLFSQSVQIDSAFSESREYGFYLPKIISRLDAIELSYLDNVFSIEFAALDYRNPLKNKYAYKMEGFNEDWTYTNATSRIATYTNLDPGDYVFHVKGSNNDGLWNEEGVSLHITITPPWWKSDMAYFGYLILIITVVTIIYRIRLARLRLQYQAEVDHLEAERYAEMDQLKSRFFANISHEFRTPLTLILGPIGKMLARVKDTESMQDLNLMQRQAKRLLELVTQLLDLSKLEAGRMKIQASKRNIVPLLKGLTLSFASLAERDKITLTFNSDLEDIPVYVDKDAITKIINNLLSNAFKFTRYEGSIQVDVTATDKSVLYSVGEICIAITDNGVGIPAERLNKIFDRFYQVDNSETREREGTGIGLALTRELVELHKGSIGVISDEGQGTTFTICLPLGKAHFSNTEIDESEMNDGDDTPVDQIPVNESTQSIAQRAIDESRPVLLIVEDNADVRGFIRSYLDNDYTCHEAIDGENGLEQGLDLIPDLIVSDVMMPKMDGVEFCKRIKTDERTSHIPVILLTAKADLESKLEGLETGADDYLTKPFEAKELLIRIRNLIEQRELLRVQFRHDPHLIPANLKLSSMDKQFMEKVLDIIGKHLADFEFNVESLSKKIFMSRQHLNRKIKALTDRTATEFIRSIRLKNAALILDNHQSTVTQVAYQTGFSSLSFFAKAFQEEFGKTPSAYLADQKVDDQEH